MKNSIMLAILSIVFSCNISEKITENDIELKETTVANVNGTRVGCGNFFRDKYKLKDGSIVKGLTAHLCALIEKEVTYDVGKGSQIEINGRKYLVVKVQKSILKRYGIVTLRETE